MWFDDLETRFGTPLSFKNYLIIKKYILYICIMSITISQTSSKIQILFLMPTIINIYIKKLNIYSEKIKKIKKHHDYVLSIHKYKQ